MPACEVAVALDVAISAEQFKQMPQLISWVMVPSGKKLGFSFSMKTLMFYLENF